MDNKVFTTVLVLVVAVLVGLSVVSRQANAPLLSKISTTQNQMLQAVERLSQDRSGSTAQAQSVNMLLARLNTLEARFNALEAKVNAGAAVAAARPAPTPAPQAAQRQGPPPVDMNKVHSIPAAHTPVIGAKNAKVTITAFMDLECPFCARFHPPVEQALDAFPGKVNFLAKNFPLSFHANAKPAAKAALAAAEQGKYREMLKGLLDNGRNLNDATYEKIATDIGLNVKKFKEDLKKNDAKYDGWIQKDMQLGGQVGVRGTPSFYINGKVTNARDFNSLKAEIEKILSSS